MAQARAGAAGADQKTEKFTVIGIPYPMNAYTRGPDGRIDDANNGWKGRGLWFTNGLDPDPSLGSGAVVREAGAAETGSAREVK